ncbi:MAG: hypothetical protein Q9217_003990 [Psora testacea]
MQRSTAPTSCTHNGSGKANPPFPSQQLCVLALCRICEPIAFMSIFPYVYYMILSFAITSDTRRIAVYVGMVTSAFAFAEFSSGVFWGRISDRVGRKPVLVTGLAGTALSMMVFGFAPNLPVALLGRALGGLLNGSILGPALGGALAQPCKNFPTIFPPDTIFDKYPFLLPNLVCAVVLAVGVLIGMLFLEETHEEKKYRRDMGLEAGRWLLRLFRRSQKAENGTLHMTRKLAVNEGEGIHILMEEEEQEEEELPEYATVDGAGPPGYQTKEGTPRQSSSRSHSPSTCASSMSLSLSGKWKGIQRAFTKQVILVIVAFGILAYHSISFDQLIPVFLSEPVSHDRPSLPFHFSGGFGYSTKKIGFMLSVQGVYAMIAQIFIFPFAARRFGTLKTFRFVIMAWPILNFCVPYMVLLPEKLREPTIYLALLTKITFHVLAFPSTAILLANAAPSMLVLGVINGVSASTASLARACGPTVTGLIHSWGLDLGSTGLAWWTNGIICAIGALESLWMEEVDGRMPQPDLTDEEAASTEALLDPKLSK